MVKLEIGHKHFVPKLTGIKIGDVYHCVGLNHPCIVIAKNPKRKMVKLVMITNSTITYTGQPFKEPLQSRFYGGFFTTITTVVPYDELQCNAFFTFKGCYENPRHLKKVTQMLDGLEPSVKTSTKAKMVVVKRKQA